MRSRKFGWQRHGSCPKHRRQPKPKAGTRREMPDGFNPTTALGGSRQLKAVIGLLNEELKERRSPPKTKRSGTQPNESGWRSGGAVSFPPTPTGMRNGADGPPPLVAYELSVCMR
jgi:hypothetical protein